MLGSVVPMLPPRLRPVPTRESASLVPLPTITTRTKRYDRIQVLRFFAALAVVLYHSSYYLQTRRPDAGAFARFFDAHFSWGVEMFFVISGFVIAHSIERMSVAEFARHRLLRIYPTYWLAVALILGVSWLLRGDVPAVGNLARALTLLPFGPIAYPLAVEWSLVYEVFFYFLVAAAALAGWKRVRDWFCALWLAAILIDCLAPPPHATAFLPTLGQIALSAFDLPFIIGIIVHRVHLRVPGAARHIALAFAPTLLIASALVARTETALLLQGLGFGALVLWAVLRDQLRRLDDSNPLSKLGDWSYGLYLTHVAAILLVLAFAADSSLSSTALFLVTVVFAVSAGSLYGAFESALYRLLLRVTASRRRTATP